MQQSKEGEMKTEDIQGISGVIRTYKSRSSFLLEGDR